MKNKRYITNLVITLFFASFFNFAQAKHLSEESIKKRTAPVGQVYKEGDKVASNAGAAASAGPRSGKKVYDTFCMVCHNAGVANAPKLADKAAWGPLMERGIADLTASAIKGKNAMPPKGTCMDCSDDEIKTAVQYMLDSVQ